MARAVLELFVTRTSLPMSACQSRAFLVGESVQLFCTMNYLCTYFYLFFHTVSPRVPRYV